MARAKSHWNTIASLYDNYVTKTDEPVLREFLEIEEELLEGVVMNMVSREAKISLIEVGAGTGRTLFSYLTNRQILANLVYLIGLDNAGAMYARMKSKFEQFKESGIVSIRNSEKFIFLHMDAVEMLRYFEKGKVNLRALISTYGENSYVQNLKPDTYNNSKKLIVNLLNTVGVMEENIRIDVLKNMVFAAGPKGKIVVSVFSRECFDEIAPVVYRSIGKITGKFGDEAFDRKKKEFRTGIYYSHWFSEEEIKYYLRKAGAKNLVITPINTAIKGFFVVADT